MSSFFAYAALFGPTPDANAVDLNRNDSTLWDTPGECSSDRQDDKWLNNAFLADLDLMASMETFPKKTVLSGLSGVSVAFETLSDSCCGISSSLSNSVPSGAASSLGLSVPTAVIGSAGRSSKTVCLSFLVSCLARRFM